MDPCIHCRKDDKAYKKNFWCCSITKLHNCILNPLCICFQYVWVFQHTVNNFHILLNCIRNILRYKACKSNRWLMWCLYNSLLHNYLDIFRLLARNKQCLNKLSIKSGLNLCKPHSLHCRKCKWIFKLRFLSILRRINQLHRQVHS